MLFDVQAFMDTLPIMGKGMLGIFIVTAVIILSMYALRSLTAENKTDKKE